MCAVQERRRAVCQVALCAQDYKQHAVLPSHDGERQRPRPLRQHLPAGEAEFASPPEQYAEDRIKFQHGYDKTCAELPVVSR